MNRFKDFQKIRMQIFGELVKRYWNGELKEPGDLNQLAYDIKVKFGFGDEDLSFINDHIRIAMGLDPVGKSSFEHELDIIRKSDHVSRPVIAKIEGICEHCENCTLCDRECKYEANVYRREKGPVIGNNTCFSCGDCISRCNFGALADKIEFMPMINLLKDENTKVYACVAPAIVGQFGENITMGQLRTAFKMMGFEDMIEVALFADILTIKEAFEFNHLVKKEEDFFLTSCCCPVWFGMTKKNYPELYKKMSPSVSPMIACGRFLKELYHDARVVFISPCIAKKSEIKEPELAGAVDFVITFRELKEILTVLAIDLADLPGDEKDQASFGGRVYARTGGVSFSVKSVVNRLQPARLIKLKARKVDGVKACKGILDDLSANKRVNFNFIEGMACEGGCVGGPRTNIDREKATRLVNEFGEDSLIMTPFDNLNVMKILKQFGINSIEEIMTNEKLVRLLTRE